MKKLFAALAVVPLLGISGVALAAEPVQLTNGQMDQVTAGASSGALVTLLAAATGTGTAFTSTGGAILITQTAVPIANPPPLPPTILRAGAVVVTAGSLSSN